MNQTRIVLSISEQDMDTAAPRLAQAASLELEPVEEGSPGQHRAWWGSRAERFEASLERLDTLFDRLEPDASTATTAFGSEGIRIADPATLDQAVEHLASQIDRLCGERDAVATDAEQANIHLRNLRLLRDVRHDLSALLETTYAHIRIGYVPEHLWSCLELPMHSTPMLLVPLRLDRAHGRRLVAACTPAAKSHILNRILQNVDFALANLPKDRSGTPRQLLERVEDFLKESYDKATGLTLRYKRRAETWHRRMSVLRRGARNAADACRLVEAHAAYEAGFYCFSGWMDISGSEVLLASLKQATEHPFLAWKTSQQEEAG